MKKLFQCVFRNNTPPHYHAFILASGADELFKLLDEYGNPYACEIYECDTLSMCVQISETYDDNGLDFWEYENIEVGELMYDVMTEPPKTKPKFFSKNKKGEIILSDTKKE